MIHPPMHGPLTPPYPVPCAGATLQPMNAVHPNETRLQELLELQRRRLSQGGPAPGAYEVRERGRTLTHICDTRVHTCAHVRTHKCTRTHYSPRSASPPQVPLWALAPHWLPPPQPPRLPARPPACTQSTLPPRRTLFRRPHHPELDGPYIILDHAPTTRAKEIAALIRNVGDSGLGPGAGPKGVRRLLRAGARRWRDNGGCCLPGGRLLAWARGLRECALGPSAAWVDAGRPARARAPG